MRKNKVTVETKAKLKVQIDENLKRVYASTLNEDVPDKFMALLDQLRSTSAPPEKD